MLLLWGSLLVERLQNDTHLQSIVHPLKCDWIDGGRTRIRTRVAGLEGQSDIQLHYTSNPAEKYLFDEL